MTQGGSGTPSSTLDVRLGEEPPLLGSKELEQRAQGESGAGHRIDGGGGGRAAPRLLHLCLADTTFLEGRGRVSSVSRTPRAIAGCRQCRRFFWVGWPWVLWQSTVQCARDPTCRQGLPPLGGIQSFGRVTRTFPWPPYFQAGQEAVWGPGCTLSQVQGFLPGPPSFTLSPVPQPFLGGPADAEVHFLSGVRPCWESWALRVQGLEGSLGESVLFRQLRGLQGLPRGCPQCRRPGFNPWVE